MCFSRVDSMSKVFWIILIFEVLEKFGATAPIIHIRVLSDTGLKRQKSMGYNKYKKK
jgi:hypothetical protein